jgi:hypothetical protein
MLQRDYIYHDISPVQAFDVVEFNHIPRLNKPKSLKTAARPGELALQQIQFGYMIDIQSQGLTAITDSTYLLSLRLKAKGMR